MLEKNKPDFQYRFIEVMKTIVPSHLSLANEVSTILGVSLDSVYRRLRCETDLTLNEVVQICHHFDVPLELLNNGLPNVVTFKYQSKLTNEEDFKIYIQSIAREMDTLSMARQKKLLIAAEDVPIFYHFMFPELAAFKMFYWLKSIVSADAYQQKQFSPDLVDKELIDVCASIYRNYMKVNSCEVWTEETISSTLKQILFYWEAGFFESEVTALLLVNQFEEVISRIQRMSEQGKKLTPEGLVTPHDYILYQSDLMIGSNCILMHSDEKKSSYLSYHSFNSMHTTNANFNEQNEKWMNNLLAKSTLLSGVAEKLRNRFFKNMYRKIEELRAHIVSGI